MNNIQIINQQEVLGKNFAVYGTFDNPLFLAKDVAEWIEHSNPTEMIRTIDDDEKLNSIILSAGQNRTVSMLTENGLYEVLMQSNKPVAKSFKKEVKVILKELRTKGITATPATIDAVIADPDFGIKLLSSLKEERTKRAELEKQVKVLQPKAEFLDRVLDTDEKIDVGQAAKILGLPFGRNTLFAKLREKGIFFQNRNEPKQTYIERGYFELKEKWIDRNTHDGFMVVKVLVNQKGLAFLSNLFQAEPKSKVLAKII
jgi:prophage antirepressor-like protein